MVIDKVRRRARFLAFRNWIGCDPALLMTDNRRPTASLGLVAGIKSRPPLPGKTASGPYVRRMFLLLVAKLLVTPVSDRWALFQKWPGVE